MLRNYQQDICRQVQLAWTRHRSVMVQMPTGTGKTWVLAALVKQWLRGAEGAQGVLVVTHRRELVEQIKQTIGAMGFDRGQREAIRVESIQGLTRRHRAVEVRPGLVIVDEAHHALARTYRCLWQEWPEAQFLGLTATPCRLSGEGFTDLFDVLVQSWGVQRFMDEGWLVGYDYFSIKPDSEDQWVIDSLQKRGADGDYLVREMRSKLDRAPRIERLYEAFARWAGRSKGLVYAVDIEHAEHIAAYYRERGVAAEAVCARTPKGVRRQWLEALRSGELQVLVNVDLFSEGFDCPDVGFIQLARPTLSLARYLQMVGRGLRRSEGKECCIILDNVGLYRAFGLPSAERNWLGWFEGWMGPEAVAAEPKGVMRYCGLIPTSVCERSEGCVVKIASRRGDGASNYGGIDLVSADGEVFFPTCARGVLKENEGIHWQALQTMVGAGLAWKGFYIPFERPEELFRLAERGPGWERMYRDSRGDLWWQRDPEAPLVRAEERDVAVASASEGAGGEPVCFSRGFVQLRREGAWVYILNIPPELGKAYRSWEIRADGRICTVGNRLYFAEEGAVRPHRIERRSEDFRLFVVESEVFDVRQGDVRRYLCRVVNEWNQPLKKELILK